ncbi:MAG: Dabb family protein [Planctomycetota bacterium]
MFIHTVYFWLKEGTPAAAKDKLIADCYKFLKAIPTTKQIWAGAPAMTPRDVVDNSYAVGLTVILDDDAGHDVYQTHPLHLEFIAENKPHWQRVQVYDFRGA